jgi:asparagine synthase (glutamine-hydrolysing)
MLHDSIAPIFGMIDGNALRKIPENEPLWPWYGQLMRKPQTMAFMLQINFWLKYYSVSIDF